MAILTQASKEWATRRDDERFLSLTELSQSMKAIRTNSMQTIGDVRNLKARPSEDGGLEFVSAKGNPAVMTNYAFGQMAASISSNTGSPFPAGFVQSLPAPLAADLINHGISTMGEEEQRQLLLTKLDSGLSIRAFNSPTYGRIWNHQVAEALETRFGNGRDGDFKIPGEFGKQVPITKKNTTIYGGDRSMFVFLADEEHKIEVPNRRNGETGLLSRGFFVWNSEVGDNTLGVATFYFDYACSNRIVWGVEGFKEVKIRHSLKAPERFLDEVGPMLTLLTTAAAGPTEQIIQSAQRTKITEETDAGKRQADIEKFFKSHLDLGPRQLKAINAVHVEEEDRPIETLWDAQVGITAFAKSIPYQQERVTMERLGGKILDLVANAA